MKIERLLSLVFYLLNREKASARELSEYFDVSLRTIQRDIDTLSAAGIPIVSEHGAQGGYSIMDSYKLSKQLVNTNDLFFILTSLESINSTYDNKQISLTIEKIKNLVRNYEKAEISKQKEKLYIDFTSLNVGDKCRDNFYEINRAVDEEKVIKFKYSNAALKFSEREVEPLTVVFKWYSWYLFAYCRLREDFRLFRISRIRDIEILNSKFSRREVDIEEQMKKQEFGIKGNSSEMVLRFWPEMKVYVQEYMAWADIEEDEEGRPIVRVKMPIDERIYGMVLSWGETVEVLEPAYLREKIKGIAENIIKIY